MLVIPLKQRISNNIKIDESGCWIWQRRITPSGYGQAWITTGYAQGTNTLAHRISYMAYKGNIPEGYQIDHLCKVRSCVNPEHLEAVTPKENIHRSNAKYKQQMARTHCPQGHKYSPANTFLAKTRHGGTSRSCKQCDYVRHQRKRDQKKELVHAA